MSVGPVVSAGALVSLLKAELAEGGRRRTSRKTGPETSTRSGEAAQAASSLRTQLVRVARQVDLADPVAVKSARRRLIRTVLVSQFGPDLREHSQWEAMLDTIEATLEQDPQHVSQFHALIQQLQQADSQKKS